MTDEARLLALTEQSMRMAEATLTLANKQLDKEKAERTNYRNIIIAILAAITIITSITVYGYFFSSYDYYELPSIENTNTNTNGG